jgi:hypothetical protein
MRCMNFCPQRAVEASYPFMVLLYFVTSVPVWVAALNWIAARWPALARLDSVWMQMLLQYGYTLTSLGVSYVVFNLLGRVPVINRLLTAITPTRYYRRYREPGTRLTDLTGTAQAGSARDGLGRGCDVDGNGLPNRQGGNS